MHSPKSLGKTNRILGVMMPVYNEAGTLETILLHVLENPLVAQVVIVDDGSTDGTPTIIDRFVAEDPRVVAVRHQHNRGKGAALRTAIHHLSTEFAIVQDADLEYDPADYASLLEPVLAERTDVVFGVRGFLGHTAHSYWFVLGNRLVTFATNVLFNCYIADMETGYKLLRTDLWRRLNLQGDRFDVEPQVTARIVRLGYRIHELPIHYYARSQSEGKKLGWRDGVKALGVLLRLRLASRASLFGPGVDQYHARRQLYLSQQHPLRRGDAANGMVAGQGLAAADGWNTGREPVRGEPTPAGAATVGEGFVPSSEEEVLAAMAFARKYNRDIVARFQAWLRAPILEVGCGTGNLTEHLIAHGQCLAIDSNQRHLDLAAARFANSTGVDFVNGDISTLGEEFEGRFRTVVAVNVLEHVPDDLLALRRMHACLEPGGHLLLWVPAHPFLFGRVDDAISHQRRYQVRGLIEQLSRSGFAVHRRQFVNPIGAVGWLINGRVLRRSSIPVAAVRSHERLLGMSRWLETLTRGRFGLSLMVVARRPTAPIRPSGSAESPTETRILEEHPSARR